MTPHDFDEPRTARDVPWDRERERRVLGGALRSWRRRARRRRAVALAATLGGLLLVARLLPNAAQATAETGDGSQGSGAEGAPSFERAPARRLRAEPAPPPVERTPSVALPSDLAARAHRAPSGFAGSGGHGGASPGSGGGAGTG